MLHSVDVLMSSKKETVQAFVIPRVRLLSPCNLGDAVPNLADGALGSWSSAARDGALGSWGCAFEELGHFEILKDFFERRKYL